MDKVHWIHDARVVTPSGEFLADIQVDEGKILDIRPLGNTGGVPQENPPARAPLVRSRNLDAGDGGSIDAKGMLVFPGGVDPHVHLNLPTPAGHSSDDFFSGSRAALAGGTTTLIDFVTPRKGQLLPDALRERQQEAAPALNSCYFHVSPIEWRDGLPDEIRACMERGVRSYKVYMAYKESIGLDDDSLLKVMRAVGGAGGLLTVHCEMGDEIERLRTTLHESGHSSVSAHPRSRPPHTESDAVKKAIKMAGQAGCPLYVVHVSAAASVQHIRDARKGGQDVMGEACPHHLLLDMSLYQDDFDAASAYVMSPPLRGEQDRQALWQGLADGTLQAVGTDHCPFMMAQKARGRDDFRKIANGVGGVEHRAALLYTYGVLSGRISLSRFVDLFAGQPARIFGLYPQKGSLEKGADADLLIWDPAYRGRISAATHRQHCDHNIYEGMEVSGRPLCVIHDGRLLVDNRPA